MLTHQRQHPDPPTWCIHCGRFDPDETAECGGRLQAFDSSTVTGTQNVLLCLLEPGEAEPDTGPLFHKG